jgi:WD40 repeat protein/tetratricopeptide (TPR) repeat protein
MTARSSVQLIVNAVVLLVLLFGATSGNAAAPETTKLAETPIVDGPAERVRVLEGNDSVGLSVSFLPDGQHVVSSARRTMRFWNVDSGEVVRQAPLAGLSAVSRHGKRVAVLWRGTVQFVDAQSGEVVQDLIVKPVGVTRTLALSPDGKWLATAGDGNKVDLWNASDGKLERSFEGHTHSIRAMAFGEDSSSIVSGGLDATIRVWDLDSQQQTRQPINAGFHQWSVQLSRDGRYILSAGRHPDVFLWDAVNGTEVRRLKGHIASVHRAVFAPDGRRVVTCSDDKTVRCWDMQTSRELARFHEHRCNVLDTAVSPDGRFAASVSGGTTVNGKWAPGDDFDVRVWRLPNLSGVAQGTGLSLTDLEGGKAGEYSSFSHRDENLFSLDLSPDGRFLATGGEKGTVRVSEIAGNRTVSRFSVGDTRARAVAFSPDGSRLVAGTHDRTLRMWDVASKKLLQEQLKVPSQVLCTRFFPDGKRVLVGIHGDVRIWDTETNAMQQVSASGLHPNRVAISADGSTIAAACHDSLTRVWDAESLELLYELKGHTDQVTACDFDPSGRNLVTGGRDRTIRFWDVGSGELTRTINGLSDSPHSVRFLADGRRVISGTGAKDAAIRVWDSQTGSQVWSHSTESIATWNLDTTADARFAVAGMPDAMTVLRLPDLQNTSAIEAYEIAKKNEGPVHRVAVLEFVDVGPSADLAPLRVALAEMLTARLGQYKRVDAVERQQVTQFLSETSLGESGLVDSSTAQRAGKVLTADYLLAGTFSGDNGKITVKATVTKIGEEQPAAQWTATAPATDLFDIERQLATRMLELLGLTKPELNSQPPRSPGSATSVAVLSFRNLGDIKQAGSPAEGSLTAEDRAALQEGLGEYLQATLSAIPDVKLVERESLAKVIAEQKLTLAGLTDPATAARVGKIVGAEKLIYGSFLQSGDKLTVIARVADAETAKVVGTEIADGNSDDIATLFEQLAQRLAVQLNVRQPKDVASLLRQAVPVRKLEAATYGSRAMAFLAKDDYESAFQNFDRALLVENDNLDLRMKYIRALYRQDHDEEVIKLAESTLALKIPDRLYMQKRTIYSYYLNSLRSTGQSEKRLKVAQQWAKTSSPSSYTQKMARGEEAHALVRAGRRDEAVAMLEADAMKVQAQGNPLAYGSELNWLYSFYCKERFTYSRQDPGAGEDSARRVVEIAEELLKLAEGRQGRSISVWGDNIVPFAANMTYRKSGSFQSTHYLNMDERIDLLNRARGVFSWDANVLSQADFQLGHLYYDQGRWQDAADSYSAFHSNSHYAPTEVVSQYDREFTSPRDWIDHHAEAQYRVARILHEELDRPKEAIAAYQKYVAEFGLASFHGPAVTKRLAALNVEPSFPKRSVLLWGGATEAMKSWQKVLKPRGFTVHLARQYHLTAADLAPYDLVILLRSGDIPFDPVDILGLRSYVATGGSLAVAVTPAWEAAAPIIHNGLLSFFGIRPTLDSMDPAPATRIDSEHPITRRIPALTARHAVGLECSDEVSLVESNGMTILAALPYRNGRVVVSSFGQWLLPDPTIFGKTWERNINYRHASIRPVSSMPLQSFSGTHAQLIQQSIDWLTESRPESNAIAERRAEFEPAWRSAREYEAQAVNREQMSDAMKRLVDNTSDEWKEEALWLAGEAHLRMMHFDQRYPLLRAPYGYQAGGEMPLPKAEYFNRLVEQFPNSPLLGFAQWRLAECEYRPVVYHGSRRLADLDDDTRTALVSKFEKVTAAEGSLPWAWTQARLGRIEYWAGNLNEAAERYRRVSESMPPGDEKVSALLSRARCLARLSKPELLKATLDAVKALPDIERDDQSTGHYESLLGDGESHELAAKLE